MKKQIIISIGREYGSGGREIAKRIAEDLGLPLYDRNMLDQIAQAKNIQTDKLKPYEERPRNIVFSRHVRGFSNSIEENVAEMEFELLRQAADRGESFVVVGRCSEVELADYEGLISIFVLGDIDRKAERIQALYHLSEKDALAKMARHDKGRKAFHNTYSKFKWGDSRGYDLCINSSRLGIAGTVQYLEKYIQERAEMLELLSQSEHQELQG